MDAETEEGALYVSVVGKPMELATLMQRVNERQVSREEIARRLHGDRTEIARRSHGCCKDVARRSHGGLMEIVRRSHGDRTG